MDDPGRARSPRIAGEGARQQAAAPPSPEPGKRTLVESQPALGGTQNQGDHRAERGEEFSPLVAKVRAGIVELAKANQERNARASYDCARSLRRDLADLDNLRYQNAGGRLSELSAAVAALTAEAAPHLEAAFVVPIWVGMNSNEFRAREAAWRKSSSSVPTPSSSDREDAGAKTDFSQAAGEKTTSSSASATTSLPSEIRGDLEQATGHSLDHVKLHAGAEGAATAAAHDARAVAIGSDIYMGEGQLNATTDEGRELIAHEVAHVVQAQSRPGPDRAAAKRDGGSSDPDEIEADTFAAQFRQQGGAMGAPQAANGGGHGAAMLAHMGEAFGADFSNVQIRHGDGVAESMGAEAAARGDDVHVAGHRDPEDKRLLGHELAHVVQQREGRVDGAQGKDGGLVASPALEAEADRAGDAIASGQQVPEELRSRGGAAQATDAPVQLNRAPLKGIDLYLKVNEVGIWAALKEHLISVPWPEPHPDVKFQNAAKFGALVWAWLYDFGLSLDEPHNIRRLVHPAVHQDVLAPLLPTYTRTWLPGIGKAFAEMIEDAARISLRRVGARYAGSAEHDASSEAHADQIIKSHAMDHPVTAALVQRGIVRYAAKSGKPDKATKPHEIKTFKPEWQGARDPALWNWVKAPPDATVEDVAASLWPNYGDTYKGESGSTRAYGLTEAAPLFGVPPGWAMDFPDARKHAPKGDVGPENGIRMLALASSKIDDEVALAQNHTDATKAPTPKAEALKTTLGDSLIAAAYLHRVLSPWKQGAAIETLIAWIKDKQSKVTTMATTDLGTWSPIIDGQKDRLKRIVGGVKNIVERTSGLGVKDPTSASAKPLAAVLDTYAQAAALSHLSDTGEQLIGEAGQQQQQLAVLMLRGVTNDMKNAVGLASQTGQQGAADLSNESLQVAADSERLQNQLAAGLPVDSGSLEETTLHAQEIAFKTRVQGLFWSVRALRMAVDQAGDGLASHIARTFHGSFKSLQQAIGPVEGTVNQIIINQQSEENFVKGNWESAAEQRAFRRNALGHNQKLLDELQSNTDLVEFLREGADTVKWQHFATGCVQMLALIGISIVAGAAGGMVMRAVGSALTRVGSTTVIAEIAEGGGLLARAGSLAARGTAHLAGATTEAGIITAAQVKMQGGSAGDAFFTNLLSTIGANAIMGTLSKDLALVRSIEMRTAGHWAKRAGKFVLKETVAVSAHTIMNVALGYVAHMVVTHKHPTAMMAREWIMQGIATGVGRYAGAFIKSRRPAHEQLGKLPESLGGKLLLTAGDELAALAQSAETKPSDTATQEVFTKQHQVIEQELRALELIEKNPELLSSTPGLKLSMKDVKAAIAELHAEQAARQPEARQFVLEAAGLEEIVPGSEYRGSADQMRRAIESAHAIGLPVGTPKTSGGKTVVKLGDVDITFHDGPATESAPAKRTPEEQFLHDVRSKLDPIEQARFDKMIGKRSAKQVHDEFAGDVTKARDQVAKAVAKERATTLAAVKSLETAELLRQWVEDLGLLNEKPAKEILAALETDLNAATSDAARKQARRNAHQRLRSFIISERMQAKLASRFHGAGKRIRKDVLVLQEQIPPAGETPYTSRDDYKSRRKSELGDSQKGVYHLDTPDGKRIYLEITDIDLMVTQDKAGADGKDAILYGEEVKTGAKDTHAQASRQQDNGFAAIREAATGGRKVKLLENTKTDITADIDLGSLQRKNMETRGPAGKADFQNSLDMTSADLDAVITRLMEPSPKGPRPP